jgi:hypothetical protein
MTSADTPTSSGNGNRDDGDAGMCGPGPERGPEYGETLTGHGK